MDSKMDKLDTNMFNMETGLKHDIMKLLEEIKKNNLIIISIFLLRF